MRSPVLVFIPVLAVLGVTLLQSTPAHAGHGMRLPYPNGTTYTASTSHASQQDQYAIDFNLGYDHTIAAAHHGTVYSRKFDSNAGSCDPGWASLANFITLQHSAEPDKSTLYLHLAQNSQRLTSLAKGETIFQGRPLAGANNTGYSCGNHLHFALQWLPATDQCCAQSLEVWFDDVSTNNGRVQHGQSYLSGNRIRFSAQWLGGSEWIRLSPGQTKTTVGQWKNVGWDLWRFSQTGNSARIGTWNPVPGQDQPSVLGGAVGCAAVTDWLTCTRVRPTTEGVDPDQTGWFQFTLKGPSTTGTYDLYMRPLIEGVLWMEDYGVFWRVCVNTGDCP